MRSFLRNSLPRLEEFTRASLQIKPSQRAASALLGVQSRQHHHHNHHHRRLPSTTSFPTSTSTSRVLFSATATSAMAPSSSYIQHPCDKIICLGKNYVEHQKEMGGPALSVPVVFLKPPSCAVVASSPSSPPSSPSSPSSVVPVAVVRVPRGRGSCHYETELVLRVGSVVESEGGSPSSGSAAVIEFDAVTIGLDLTLRDVQRECKDTGHPWESAKVFRGSAVLGEFVPLSSLSPSDDSSSSAASPSSYLDLPFELDLDGKTVQKGAGSEMMMLPRDAIRYVHGELFEVRPGDLFFTGTPAGVGPVLPGQVAEVRLLKKKRKKEGEEEVLVRYKVRFE